MEQVSFFQDSVGPVSSLRAQDGGRHTANSKARNLPIGQTFHGGRMLFYFGGFSQESFSSCNQMNSNWAATHLPSGHDGLDLARRACRPALCALSTPPPEPQPPRRPLRNSGSLSPFFVRGPTSSGLQATCVGLAHTPGGDQGRERGGKLGQAQQTHHVTLSG